MKVCCGVGTNIYGGMDHISRRARHPAVMTMSLGSTRPSTPASARTAIDKLYNRGVTVIVAAGNDNDNACKWSYAFVKTAIGVGSVDKDFDKSSFSNYGRECVPIYAPGRDI